MGSEAWETYIQEKGKGRDWGWCIVFIVVFVVFVVVVVVVVIVIDI